MSEEEEVKEEEEEEEEKVVEEVRKSVILSFDIGIVNMAYCLIDEDDENVIDWECFSIKGSTMEQQCRKLASKLDDVNFHNNSGYDMTILIERQPKINAKMRVIEGYILMYYVLRGGNHKKIITYSPKHKLKCYVAPTDNPIVLKCKPGNHYYRKRLGIEHCRRILNGDKKYSEKIKNIFDKSKKKDDLADTMLQALSYIRFKSPKLKKSR
jgi:hypothetical protein